MARIRKTNKEVPNKMVWYIGGYKRLSKEDLLSGESRSIVSQDFMIDNHINYLLSMGEDVRYTDSYVDDGTSGVYNNNRVSFQRMITDIESGKINAIIVCDLSRMFRNEADQKYYLEYYFPSKKIRVISCSLPQLDTFYDPNAIYRTDVKFHGISNANQPIETSIKIKGRLATRRKMGMFVGSFAPYGYKKDEKNKNQLLIDDEAAEVVRDIFNWFVYEGLSISRIRLRLNDELGIVNPSEYKRLHGLNYKNPSSKNNSTLWNDKTIKTILTSEYYIGNMDQHKTETKFLFDKKIIVPVEEIDEDEYCKNTHEAIIDTRTFEIAQTLLTRDTRTSPKTKKSYMLSGFLACGDCNKSIVAKPRKGKVSYYCSTYLKLSKLKCTCHKYTEDELKDIVLKIIQLQIAISISMKEEIEKIKRSDKINTVSDRIEKLLSSNQTELANSQKLLDASYYDWKNGDISREQYIRIKSNAEDVIEQKKKVIESLLAEKETMASIMTQSNEYLDTFCKYENIKELDRKVLVELIDKVYIYENNEFDTVFNYDDVYKLTLEFIKNNQ